MENTDQNDNKNSNHRRSIGRRNAQHRRSGANRKVGLFNDEEIFAPTENTNKIVVDNSVSESENPSNNTQTKETSPPPPPPPSPPQNNILLSCIDIKVVDKTKTPQHTTALPNNTIVSDNNNSDSTLNTNNLAQTTQNHKQSIVVPDPSSIDFINGSKIKCNEKSLDVFTSENLNIKANKNIIIEASNTGIGTSSPTEMLDVCGNIKLNDNLVFSVNNVDNIMSFKQFMCSRNMYSLPSVHNQPLSLTRTTVLNKSNYNKPLFGSYHLNLQFDDSTIMVNQLNISVNEDGSITIPQDVNGQYLEIYANMEMLPISNKTILSFDLSGLDNSQYNVIDTKYIEKTGVFNVTFGPYMIAPGEIDTPSKYICKITNNTNHIVNIRKYKLIVKSLYL